MRFFSILAFLCASVSASFLEEPIMMELDEPALSPADPQESMELLRQFNISKLVYGGRQARPGQFPQHAYLFLRKGGGASICGASLISKTHAVTAAHCTHGLQRGSRSKIMVGGTNANQQGGGAQWREIHRAYNHPGYGSGGTRDDIAVVEFNPPVTLNRNTKLARIATDDSKLIRQQKTYVTGYGTYKYSGERPVISEALLWAEIKLFSSSECQRLWPGQVTERQLCAGSKNKGAGPGDSGGPIQVLSNKQLWQVGLTSFGTSDINNDEHNQDRFPTVFTRVSSYCDFLGKSTNGAFRCQ
ncbi:hypothetical protein QR680_013644 [Steinernema hermaphroditum]|uniref:Peptidase S1 domain-containing protein n=1 Tax=Steinernema hermaphroditum TaxID=289476 RepID=A0AA39M2W0_9BILA|nr:hypothetical protein QR680_013644 [Steinernema hermaphroditum]